MMMLVAVAVVQLLASMILIIITLTAGCGVLRVAKPRHFYYESGNN